MTRTKTRVIVLITLMLNFGIHMISSNQNVYAKTSEAAIQARSTTDNSTDEQRIATCQATCASALTACLDSCCNRDVYTYENTVHSINTVVANGATSPRYLAELQQRLISSMTSITSARSACTDSYSSCMGSCD